MTRDVPGEPMHIESKEVHMLAALNMGLVGTVIVMALVIAVVFFFMRRA